MLSPKIKLFLVVLVLAIVAAPASAHLFYRDPGGDGMGGCSSSCSRECSDGSWSGIGCLSGQCAYCTCSGYPVRANPYCA